MFYVVVPPDSAVFCREKSGLDSKNLKKFEKSIKKGQKTRKTVRAAVNRAEQARKKTEKRPTGRIIYKGGIAYREMK
jgi:hypothetical protein